MEEQTKTELEEKIELARRSANLVVSLDTCNSNIKKLNRTVHCPTIYNHTLIVKSNYGDNKDEAVYWL